MKAKISTLYSYIYSFIVFLYSLYLLPHLTEGDQLHYRNFYENCFTYYFNISSQMRCYGSTLGTQEPVYFLLVKFANPILSKDLFISISNGIFTFLLVKLIFKFHEKNRLIHVFIFFILTNYYITVLFFSAERLKFAFLFLLISFFVKSNTKSFFARIIMVFTHLQSILILLALMIGEIFNNTQKLPANNQKFYKLMTIIFGIAAILAAYIFLQDQIDRKFIGYSEASSEANLGLIGLIKAFMFITITYISTKKLLPIVIQLPLMAAAIVLGPGRTIIMVVIIYISTVIYYRKKQGALLTIILIYFSYKSIEFINNVYQYGTGFIPS